MRNARGEHMSTAQPSAMDMGRGLRVLDVTGAVARDDVVVLFADGFSDEELATHIQSLRRSAVALVIVTDRDSVGHDAQDERALVVPRPVWGRTLLDAIRTHLNETRQWPPSRESGSTSDP